MRTLYCLLICLTCSSLTQEQLPDPPLPQNLPEYWRASLEHIAAEVSGPHKAAIRIMTKSPGGLPVYLFAFGEANRYDSHANYNSALGGMNPVYYARKDRTTKPVLLFLGPVHGQEMEGIVGLLNLIHILETGKDYRGKAWPGLAKKLGQCRVLVVPCANPDGRKRCPYDTWVGLPNKTMTKYGQGTRKNGTLYGWTGSKTVHPMKGDVGLLGAYFNDDGINPMHDDFFAPMAAETKAILDLARAEAPDISVSLHSHEGAPCILQPGFVPWFIKKRVRDLSAGLKTRYEQLNLPYGPVWEPSVEDEIFPPRSYFNLVSALHHVSGTMSFTFECSHGSVDQRTPQPLVQYEQILDIQLLLYEEMAGYILANRLLWTSE